MVQTDFFPGDLALPQAFSRDLWPATIVYTGEANDKISIYIVNVNFSKIVFLKGRSNKFLMWLRHILEA
jgi:hypothetical protein